MNLMKSAPSYGNKKGRNATSKTPAMGPWDPPKRSNTIENRPNIQDVRYEVASSKGIYQQKLEKKVYLTILFKVRKPGPIRTKKEWRIAIVHGLLTTQCKYR